MFTFKLIVPAYSKSKVGKLRPRAYDPELDSIVSVLIDICRFLQYKVGANFEMTGFGINWPVDVGCDFCLFLEDLPDVVTWLSGLGDGEVMLGLVEQGIEKLILFEAEGDLIKMTCRDLIDVDDEKLPTVYGIEKMSPEDLGSAINKIVVDFSGIVESRCGKSFSHPWFQTWLREVRYPNHCPTK